MPISKLIRINGDGTFSEDIVFERKDKTFIQELRECLTPEDREKISKHINDLLNRCDLELGGEQ